ncbi:MAG: RNA polymerase sigma factor [Pseudomonadales bacterium]
MRTERQLLDAIAHGDQEALRLLHQSYYRRLGQFLLRMTGDVDISAEVANDVFLVIWNKAASFRGDSALSTWILGIAYKLALRANSKKRHFEPLDESITAKDTMEQQVQRRALNEGLERLSVEHRAVIVLTYEFGYSYREIGQILNCPENTIKTRMFHARRSLRALLET